MKSLFKWLAILLLCIVLIGAVGLKFFGGKLMDRAIISSLQKAYDREKLLDPALYPGIRVILAGTGTPLSVRGRAHPCTAVIADGEFMVFDDGGGGLRELEIDGYPTYRITRVFLTHMHSDHMGGLGNLTYLSWLYGRGNDIHIYGPDDSNRLTHTRYPPTSEEYLHGNETTGGLPDTRRIDELTEEDLIPGSSYIPGIRTMVEGLARAYEPDVIIRESNRQMPPDHYDPLHVSLIPHPIPDMDTAGTPPDFGWGEMKTVFTSDDGKLVVKAFLVDHYPCFPAYGYRVEYAGRVVVISGDTEKLTYMSRYAAGADMLVHEAMNMRLVDYIAGILEEHFSDQIWAGQIRAAASHHTDVLDLARETEEAGVARLVLTHLPPVRGPIGKRLFMKGMKEIYHGPIVLGEDGMSFYLEPAEGGPPGPT